MRLDRLLALSVFVLCIAPVPSSAQQVVTSTPTIAPRGVVIGAGGLSAGSGTSGGSFGLTATFSLTDRVAIEGSGLFSMSHMSTDSQSVTGSLLFNLRPARESERIVPYVAGGLGLYRSSFDMNGLGFGSFMNQYSGYTGMMSLAGGGFGMMSGSYGAYVAGNPVYTPANVPMFYGNRMGMLTPTNGRFGMQSFTDPAVSFGLGVQIRAGEHFVVRPDARAITAFANGDRRTVGVVTIGLGYGF